MAILLEVSEVLHHEPLLLSGYRSAAGLRHPEQYPLAVLRLARVVPLLVPRDVLLGDEVELAELADDRSRDHWPLREDAQVVPLHLAAGNVTALPRSCGQRVAHAFPVPLLEFLALRRAAGHKLLVDGEAPQDFPGPDAALEHKQILVDSVMRLLCEPFHGGWKLLRLRNAGRCSRIALCLLQSLELGLLLH